MPKMIGVEEALDLPEEEIKDYYKDHVNPALGRIYELLNFDKKYVRAQGMKVFDSEGNEYLDFLGAFGALNFGHNPRPVVEAVRKVENAPNLIQVTMGALTSAAARNLSIITPGDLTTTFFCNSGAEAVEGAIKLARIASGKEKIIYCSGSFHGKTMGALSLTGRKKYQKPFRPLMPGTGKIPFGNTEELEFMLKQGNTAAFIVEPVQGEAGIILPPSGYLKEVRRLCDRYDTYLIFDEIQTGIGRTGRNFACEHEAVAPDIMTLAKSLGGGVMPAGAFICKRDIWDKAYGSMETALLHSSTFGGNTRAAAAVIASLKLLQKWELNKQAAEKGEYLLTGLVELQEEYDLIKEVRGKGLMVGLELKRPDSGILDKLSGGFVSKASSEYMGAMVAGTLLNDYRIITAYTLNNPHVIRLEPPLIVTRGELDTLLTALDEIFANYRGLMDLTVKSARGVIGKYFKNR